MSNWSYLVLVVDVEVGLTVVVDVETGGDEEEFEDFPKVDFVCEGDAVVGGNMTERGSLFSFSASISSFLKSVIRRKKN